MEQDEVQGLPEPELHAGVLGGRCRVVLLPFSLQDLLKSIKCVISAFLSF